MRAEETSDEETTADADLVLRSRSGDADAFGELWQRHYRSGIVVARNVSRDLNADDLVQEAYAKVFQAIRRGGGPTGSFRAYLFTAIRNTAATWGRAWQTTSDDVPEEFVDPQSSEEAVDAALDRSLTVTAFRSLPSRWQEVLWYTEVEGMKPAEVGPLLGMKAGAVSQLAFRAREGLRESWIQAHIASVPEDSDCKWTIERLGARARQNLAARDRAKAEAHIASCPRCAIVASEADDVGARLVMVLLPLAAGVAGAGGYLASLQHGGEAVALMAMPQEVVEGASAFSAEAVTPDLVGHGAELFGHLVDQGAALVGAAAGVAGLAGAGAGASSGAAGGASPGGGFLGVAGIVTAGVASLAVAAVVAAAALLPGSFNGQNDTASALDDSAAAAEIEPDDELADGQEEQSAPAPPVEEKPAPEPAPDKKKPVAKKIDVPASDDVPPAAASAPAQETGAQGDAADEESEPDTRDPGDSGTSDDSRPSDDSDETDDSDDSGDQGDPDAEFTKLAGNADWDGDVVRITVSGGKPGEGVRITADGQTLGRGDLAEDPAGATVATAQPAFALDKEGTLDESFHGDAWREDGADLVVTYTSSEAPKNTLGTFSLEPAPDNSDGDDGSTVELTLDTEQSCAVQHQDSPLGPVVTAPITLVATAPKGSTVTFTLEEPDSSISFGTFTEKALAEDGTASYTWGEDKIPDSGLFPTRKIVLSSSDGQEASGPALGELRSCQ